MTLQELEHSLNEYNTLYESGEISKEEYRSLLEGLEVEKAIFSTAEEMARKEELNKYIVNTINILSAIA